MCMGWGGVGWEVEGERGWGVAGERGCKSPSSPTSILPSLISLMVSVDEEERYNERRRQ